MRQIDILPRINKRILQNTCDNTECINVYCGDICENRIYRAISERSATSSSVIILHLVLFVCLVQWYVHAMNDIFRLSSLYPTVYKIYYLVMVTPSFNLPVRLIWQEISAPKERGHLNGCK